MKSVKLTKEQKIRRSLRWIAYVCFGTAIGLIVVMSALMVPAVQKSLQHINDWFTAVELFIARYESIPALLLILSLFLVKSFLPIIPFSVLFIGSGMVFSELSSFFINLFGFCLLCSVKFFIGKKRGGGGVHKLANRSKTVYRFMDFGGKGNKWMLALMRFIPVFPVNTVSRAYGGTTMKYHKFVAYSVFGFLPRLVLWSVIGFNIFDPFTPGFVIPVSILLIISGGSLLLLNVLLDRKDG